MASRLRTRPLVFMTLLFVLLTLFQVPPAFAADYTVTGTASPTKVNPGQSVAITATVTAAVTRTVLVDIEVYSPAGKKVFQKFFDRQALAAGQTAQYPVRWTLPADAAAGTYTVSVGIFNESWAGMISWHAGVARFEAGLGADVPDFTGFAAASPSPVDAGQSATITADLTATLDTTASAEIRVKGPSGAQVFQQRFDNQAFTANIATRVTATWATPARAETGTYTIELYAVSPEGAEWYKNTAAGQFSVNGVPLSFTVTGTAAPSSAPANGPVTITAYVTPSATTNILVDVEVFGPGGTRVLQQVYDNVAVTGGFTREIPVTWNLPLTAANGTYTVSVGIFKPAWNGMYQWFAGVTTFEVYGGVAPTFASAVTGSPNPAAVGTTVSISAVVTSDTSVPANVFVDVYSPAGARVAQQQYTNQNFTAGQGQTYSFTWTVPAGGANGDYRSAVTVKSADGGQTYHQNSSAGGFSVNGGVDVAFAATAAVSPDPVRAGATAQVVTDITSTAAANVTAVVTALDQNGAKLAEQEFANQALTAGTATRLTFDWTLPRGIADQTGTLKVDLYSGDLAVLLSSTNPAGRFVIFTPPDEPAPPPATPPTLPSHFSIGLTAYPDEDGLTGWMPQSGIPWDYGYQYLAGGVNTPGNGWRWWGGWNDGMWAYNYAKLADSKGYMPVFTYYQVLQSTGTCDACSEDKRDLSNLNNVDIMREYFAEFKRLMQLMGTGTYNGVQGFGKTMIVHIEPDLAGYAQQAVLDNARCHGYCTGQGNDPSFLTAAVSSTGLRELEGMPDTYQGYNWALLRLRDLYAPNVLLAFHISGWGPIYDVGSNTDPNLDVAALGVTSGEFANLSGARTVPTGRSTYDLIFNDVLDRDAAYYKIRYGSKTSWWDRLNVKLPHFHQWERWFGQVLRTTGKPGMVWQVPLGNQYFATMDNTPGHYQDNRVEYFFDNVQELAEIGVVGLMFGWGARDQTSQFDGTRNGVKDGITNGTPFCTTDGLSSGQVCNDHLSTVPDDDGGYLRMRATEYYQNPYMLEP